MQHEGRRYHDPGAPLERSLDDDAAVHEDHEVGNTRRTLVLGRRAKRLDGRDSPPDVAHQQVQVEWVGRRLREVGDEPL